MSHKNRCRNPRTDRAEMWWQEGESEETEWSHLQDKPRSRGEPICIPCLLEILKGGVCVHQHTCVFSGPTLSPATPQTPVRGVHAPAPVHTPCREQGAEKLEGCTLLEPGSDFPVVGRLSSCSSPAAPEWLHCKVPRCCSVHNTAPALGTLNLYFCTKSH